MNIKDFKKGDVVTRVEASDLFGIDTNPLTGEIVERRDRSYIGDKMTFFGIANGVAYFHRHDMFTVSLLGKESSLPLDKYSEGWEYWIDPQDIYENGSQEVTSKLSKEQILAQITKAVDAQDFERATELRDELEERYGNC